MCIRDRGCSVVDLPGIYSLRPYTAEEIVTRDFILNQKPDGIINIVDATNIERNLYLTLQLLEMQIPMVLALNMMDEVRGNGGTIDVQKMSDELGIPVVPIAAAKNEGIEELVEMCIRDRIIADALERCRKARLEILDKVMLPCISEPRADVSEYAPKMISMKTVSYTHLSLARCSAC